MFSIARLAIVQTSLSPCRYTVLNPADDRLTILKQCQNLLSVVCDGTIWQLRTRLAPGVLERMIRYTSHMLASRSPHAVCSAPLPQANPTCLLFLQLSAYVKTSFHSVGTNLSSIQSKMCMDKNVKNRNMLTTKPSQHKIILSQLWPSG